MDAEQQHAAQETPGFYADRHPWGRVWKGPFTNESNYHYAYSDGETDPEGRLIWIQARTTRPLWFSRVSEAQACALLLGNRWPNLTTEGWEEEIAIQIISGIIYGQPLKITRKGEK